MARAGGRANGRTEVFQEVLADLKMAMPCFLLIYLVTVAGCKVADFKQRRNLRSKKISSSPVISWGLLEILLNQCTIILHFSEKKHLICSNAFKQRRNLRSNRLRKDLKQPCNIFGGMISQGCLISWTCFSSNSCEV